MDVISRQAAIDALKKISFSHWFECGEYLSEDTREIEIINSNKALEAIEALPSAQPEKRTNKRTETHACDLIDREAAVDAIYHHLPSISRTRARTMLHEVPSAQAERKKGEWTTEQVAELLANMFGEECACNFNGIDEWLPSACKYSETTCPNPKEKHGCWMQFLIQGGADMKGEDNDA